ncbi:DUF2971 domain-containing protein [Aeromonas sp. R7-1]|uniref:DUF2971 domain-containing protein n=1 Tax=Aeromonas sp. R7-1 TaxID=3138473 RepID=UPI0034A2DECC
MDIFYKYTSLLPLSYFDEPTIKLSPTVYLNDPFEYDACENIASSIKEFLEKIGLDENTVNKGVNACEKGINMMLSLNGIVSFSETPRNSLMWAHYSNQHNGICIGYNRSVLEHVQLDDLTEKEKMFLLLLNSPKKINYDNLRFESFGYTDTDIKTLSKNATINHLFKKSDEWIYEKEHRCIIPYIKANTLIVTSDNAKIDNELSPSKSKVNISEHMTYQQLISNQLAKGYISKTQTPNKYIINSDKINSVVCAALQSSKDAIHLINIDENAIKSIYFGCKVDKKIIKPYYDKLHDKYELYQFHLSKKRFELIPIKITSSMFDTQ